MCSIEVIREICQQFVKRDVVLKAASEIGLKGEAECTTLLKQLSYLHRPDAI